MNREYFFCVEDCPAEDTRQKCFICNIEASAFDRLVDGGFEQHIKASHNMWCYLCLGAAWHMGLPAFPRHP